MFRNPIITSEGKTIHLKALTGQPMRFTSIRMGSGIVVDSDDPSLFTGLKTEKVSMVCTSAERSIVNDVANLQCTFYNNLVESGFNWTECGIFAEDPDTGDEVLYAYTYTPANESQYIPPATSEIIEKVITIPIDITGCDRITFIVGSSEVFATLEDLELARQNNIKTFSELPDANGNSPAAVLCNGKLYVKV